MSSTSKKVEIYHRINKLKAKAGIKVSSETGFIDPDAIKKAQVVIDEKEQTYPIEVKNVLDKLVEAWEKLKETKEEERPALLEQIYNFANHIKDLTATYGQDLMHDFGLSLRDFCEKIDVNKPEHHIIVQAHIDVMWVTYEEKLRGDDSAKAQELKLIVAKAIEKYS